MMRPRSRLRSAPVRSLTLSTAGRYGQDHRVVCHRCPHEAYHRDVREAIADYKTHVCITEEPA